jgi:cephalosporin-C deacetylase-like acetyl esterase
MALFDLPLPELERYLPELDEPADLDAFWARTLAEARTVDLDVRRASVDTGLTLIDTEDVTFAGFGGHPIKAWVTRPGTCTCSWTRADRVRRGARAVTRTTRSARRRRSPG